MQKTKVIAANASKATTNPRAFWRTLSKFNKSSNYPLRIHDPENPEVIIDHAVNIKKALTSYWSKLGTSQNENSNSTDRISTLESQPPHPDSLQSVTINDESIKYALSRLKNGKATGVDYLLVPGEFLKNEGPVINQKLFDLFCKIKLLEQLPQEWFEGIVKPIFKEGIKH